MQTTKHLILHRSQHHAADIGLACVETITTFMVAYPAAVALGKVLLQTAPIRGLPGGQMESFLRVMREVCDVGVCLGSHAEKSPLP